MTPETKANCIYDNDDLRHMDEPTKAVIWDEVREAEAAKDAEKDAEFERYKDFACKLIDEQRACAERAEAELAEIKRILSDPAAVHLNILRGTIARPSDQAMQHIIGDRDGHESLNQVNQKGGDGICDMNQQQTETAHAEIQNATLVVDSSNAAPESNPWVAATPPLAPCTPIYAPPACPKCGCSDSSLGLDSPPFRRGHVWPVEPATKQRDLKIDPEVFQAVKRGEKTFEIRFDDRGFKVGDTLLLRETEHTGAAMKSGAPLIYTGQSETRIVTHILRGPIYGLSAGWVILSMRQEPSAEWPDVIGAGDGSSAPNTIDEARSIPTQVPPPPEADKLFTPPAKQHNPDSLTPEQVQQGAESMVQPEWLNDPDWMKRPARLLYEDEVGSKYRHILAVEARHDKWTPFWSTSLGYLTYRTKLTRAELRQARGPEPESSNLVPKASPTVTPETDTLNLNDEIHELKWSHGAADTFVFASVARTLEVQRDTAQRERDEAREQLAATTKERDAAITEAATLRIDLALRINEVDVLRGKTTA